MKKDILFINPSLVVGGVERSLLNVLHFLDYDRYEVDLFLLEETGLFVKEIPKEVQVIKAPEEAAVFLKKWPEALVKLFLLSPKGFFLRLLKMAAGTSPGFRNYASQKDWLLVKHLIPPLAKTYDVVVGYKQTLPIYLAVDKVKAKKRIGFIHSDYEQGGYDPAFDAPYFQKLDYLAAVSPSGERALKTRFSDIRERIVHLQNPISAKRLFALAKKTGSPYRAKPGWHLVTVGRLIPVKGYDLALKALRILKEEGYPVHWHWVGDGPDRQVLQAMVNDLGLKEEFVFWGEQENPYPFIHYADVYCQPSRWEGFGMALDEARALHKAFVSTRFPAADERIEDAIDGILCEVDPVSIAGAVKRLLDNPVLKTSIEEVLKKKQTASSREQIAAFLSLIES